MRKAEERKFNNSHALGLTTLPFLRRRRQRNVGNMEGGRAGWHKLMFDPGVNAERKLLKTGESGKSP